MTFVLWHILAIVSMIAVSFALGYLTGKADSSVWKDN